MLVVAVGLIAAILGLAGMGFHQQVDKAASAPSRRHREADSPHQQATPVAARTSSTASRLYSMPHLNDAATRHPFLWISSSLRVFTCWGKLTAVMEADASGQAARQPLRRSGLRWELVRRG